RSRGGGPDPSLSLPERRRPAAAGLVRPRRLRPPARRPDHPAAARQADSARASALALLPRALSPERPDPPRLSRPRDDVRALQIPGPTRGDGAQARRQKRDGLGQTLTPGALRCSVSVVSIYTRDGGAPEAGRLAGCASLGPGRGGGTAGL